MKDNRQVVSAESKIIANFAPSTTFKKMKTILLFVLVCIVLHPFETLSATDDIGRLDSAIARRWEFQHQKELRIDSLRSALGGVANSSRKFDVYNELYKEFLTFNFDSVMTCVGNAKLVADIIGTYDARGAVSIHKALALATSGHFSQAVDILKGIDSDRLPKNLKDEYFAALEWTYGVWAEYSEKRTIAPELNAKSLVYLDSLIDVTDHDTPEFTYRLAEKALRTKNYETAEKYYLQTISRIPVATRLYAQATYALAMVYRELGNTDKYREWLINAAISDQMVPLKENLALQELAIYLKNEEGDIVRANSYLKIALDDAIFYNNRLRMLEIAEKIPDITNVYQETIENKNSRLQTYICVIGVLLFLLGIVSVYLMLQRRKISKANDAMFEMNERLKVLNEKLNQTNSNRERYVSLFIDLCVTYIDKLNRFPTVLKLKVKTIGDLNSVADRYVRPSEAETREMFFNFDSTFLRLYPDFVQEFNKLLQSDKQVLPKKGELLNTDLRIYALVRMGITDSNKIASLLFLSSQTIFNHRTQVRNRAINRVQFEEQVLNVCTVIPIDNNNSTKP